MAMELTTILAMMITALVMQHHLSLTVAAIADHTTIVPNATSLAGFSFRQVANHTIRRGSDGFLHLQHSSSSSQLPSSATAPHPEMNTRLQLPYAVTVAVGTGSGRSEYQLKLETSTSLTWLQCKPCSLAALQHNPIFNPTASPTFHNVTATSELCQPPYQPVDGLCGFHLEDPRGFSVQGLLSLDNLTNNDMWADRHHFGCSHSTQGFESEGEYADIFTIGRARTSLVMQLAARRRGLAHFSYCLSWGQGFLRFGADVPHSSRYMTTRILPALHAHESEYYVGLVGVSLGTRRLDGIRSEMLVRHEDGQGGCMVDLGTPLMVMVQEAYDVVEEAMLSDLERHRAERVKRPGYSLCVRATEAAKGRLPSLSLHFSEEEAVLVFSPEQLFLMMNDDQQGKITCLAMEPGRRTVIGAMQQVDTQFVFDLKDSKIYFASDSCTQDTAQVRSFE